jgi:hypothetical protein
MPPPSPVEKKIRITAVSVFMSLRDTPKQENKQPLPSIQRQPSPACGRGCERREQASGAFSSRRGTGKGVSTDLLRAGCTYGYSRCCPPGNPSPESRTPKTEPRFIFPVPVQFPDSGRQRAPSASARPPKSNRRPPLHTAGHSTA